MNHEEYVHAANYWADRDTTDGRMPQDELKSKIETFIAENNTCALATGNGDFNRCTPIEYTWHSDAFWMFSEGGLKFRALENNKNVCLAIYKPYNGFGNLFGLQISGTAEIVEPFSAEYIAAAEFKKIPIAALKKLPEPMHLIKITPADADFLCSDFKKEGYSSRQHFCWQE